MRLTAEMYRQFAVQTEDFLKASEKTIRENRSLERKAVSQINALVETANNQAPFKDFKKVRYVRNPLKVDGIDNELKELLEQVPLVRGSCYKIAAFIASSIPGVNVITGVYSSGSVKRKRKSSSIDALAKARLEAAVAFRAYGNEAVRFPLKERKEGKNNWFHHSNDLYCYRHDDQIYCTHSWNEYKGIHFDALAHLLYKTAGGDTSIPLFWSETHKKLINWIEYRANRKFSDFYKNPQLRKVTRSLALWDMVTTAREAVDYSYRAFDEWPSHNVLWDFGKTSWLKTGVMSIGDDHMIVSGSISR